MAPRRVFANFRLLFSGRVVAALLNLGAMATLARALELAEFGTVVLVHVYALTVRGLVNVKPSLTIVRWGVPLLEGGEAEQLRRLLELTRRIDRCIALGSTTLAAALAPVAGMLLEWGASTVGYCALYSGALLFSGIGSARGYLQASNRFDLLAQQMAVGPGIRFAGALAASFASPRIETFLAIWGCSLATEYLFLIWQGGRKVRHSGLRISWFGGGSFAAFPGLPHFLSVTYVQALLELVPNRLATLMVGATLGAESAGLFKAARDCSTLLTRPAVLLSQAAFPDLTRLWHEDHRKFRRLIVRVCLIAGSIGLGLTAVAMLVGGWLLDTLFGPEFSAAAVLLVWLIFGAAFDLGGAALTPAGYAMDRAGRIMAGRILGTLVFLSGYFTMQGQFGLDGVGVAVAAGSIITWLALVAIVNRNPPGGAGLEIGSPRIDPNR